MTNIEALANELLHSMEILTSDIRGALEMSLQSPYYHSDLPQLSGSGRRPRFVCSKTTPTACVKSSPARPLAELAFSASPMMRPDLRRTWIPSASILPDPNGRLVWLWRSFKPSRLLRIYEAPSKQLVEKEDQKICSSPDLKSSSWTGCPQNWRINRCQRNMIWKTPPAEPPPAPYLLGELSAGPRCCQQFDR